MEIMTIDASNIDQEHICCAIGNDKENKARARTKKEWLKARFDDGLTFKRLDQRGKVFIEYMPIEKVWKPVIGMNYLVINCLWVSGQFKGKGHATRLLQECVDDARKQKKDGVAVVTSGKVKPFLTDKQFFVRQGFVTVDRAEPYFELLTLKLNKDAMNPRFTEKAKSGKCGNEKGFTFIYSNQCVFMEEYVGLLNGVTMIMDHPCSIVKLQTCEDARENGSPFGTLGIYYNGRFLTHELMTEEKFRKLAAERCVRGSR